MKKQKPPVVNFKLLDEVETLLSKKTAVKDQYRQAHRLIKAAKQLLQSIGDEQR